MGIAVLEPCGVTEMRDATAGLVVTRSRPGSPGRGRVNAPRPWVQATMLCRSEVMVRLLTQTLGRPLPSRLHDGDGEAPPQCEHTSAPKPGPTYTVLGSLGATTTELIIALLRAT